MTTGDQWCGFLADDAQLPSSANLRAKPRISRSAWTARRSNDLITTVPGFFREAAFWIVFVSTKSTSGGRMNRSPGELSDEPVLISQ
jgi:hypothetical protein